MTMQPDRLDTLLERINAGRAADTLPELDGLLRRQPLHPGLLALKAEALRLAGRVPEAVQAFRQAGERGAGPRNWLAAGVLLAAERSTDQALECLHRALEGAPNSEEVLDALVTTLFNANRHAEGVELARRQLTLSVNPAFLSHAALLLQSCDLHEESSNAFKRILELAPEEPALAGAALVPARFTCEWSWVDTLLQKIRAYYDEGRFGAPQEYPLTHIAWCADEARNLEVTRAYIERMVPRADSVVERAVRPAGARIRVGYLSCDFRNHATMHLMAGLLESHDRERFEVFAYDYSSPDVSTYRQRFLESVEHHVPVHSLADRQAAARIADDALDILFDLKLYTGGGRPGILAYRPAPLQAAYLGYPGSAASPHIDYIVSDRFVTPDRSAPYYTEKLCRLPHTYQCNDRKRFAAPEPGPRSLHALPEGKVVFGAFNQSYKIDRGSFAVWLRILAEVPDSVLWLLGQSHTAIANLSHHAQAAGLAPERLIFAPFAAPHEHLARLQLADAVLDTLVCNGHTTTSDALWAGVPVVTAKGRHFASRVSESLLNAMELPELVGADPDDMVRIAKRIGTDAQYRAALRAKVAANRLAAPLFDTPRFTRNFERAIEMMVDRHRSGAPVDHIDVPDCGSAQPLETPRAPGPVSRLRTAYSACPLCNGAGETLGFANCSAHALWHEPLPPTMEWVRCSSCGHVHTRHFWTAAGRAELLRPLEAHPAIPSWDALAARRATWAPLVSKVVGFLGGYAAVAGRETRPIWVDVGCGDGTLAMTAADYGFAAVGIESRAAAVERIRQLGFNAVHQDFMTLAFEVVPDVLTLLDVLQQVPHPREALDKAAQVLRPGGLLVLSTPDLSSSGWRIMEAARTNPYWTEIEQHHAFSRERLIALLRECDFDIVDLELPGRSPAQMEIYAVRRASSSPAAPSRAHAEPAPRQQAYHVLQIRPAGYAHSDALTELAQSVYYGLKRLGLPVSFDGPPPPSSRAIVFGAHLLDADSVRTVPPDAIIFNSEQLDADSPWLSRPYMEMLRTHPVWDYSAENAQRLARLGVHAVRHVPVGYVPELSRIAPAVEDIDVLFYGSLNPRRQLILQELERRGLKVVAVTGCYGEARDRLIARSKVVLNLHYYESKVFESVRVSYLLTNSKAVVAECGAGTSIEPDLLQGLRAVPYDRLVDACVDLVRDEAARRALAQQGHAVFSARPAEPILAAALGIRRQDELSEPAPSAPPAHS